MPTKPTAMPESPHAASRPASDPLPAGKLVFTVQELATLLGVNHKTVRAEIDGGRLKHVRLGRVIRIPRAEVLRLIGG